MVSTGKKIRPGDMVRIRTWEDMVGEFGEQDGVIPCRGSFVKAMENLCGKSFIVERLVYPSPIGSEAEFVLKSLKGRDSIWTITEDMLEKIEPPVCVA